MERFYKAISILLHPILIPTIGTLVYFLLIPKTFNNQQKAAVLTLIFILTYLIPIIILVVFKKFNLIKSYNAFSIKERKLPIAIMVFLFYILGNILSNISQVSELGVLFYATSCGLLIIYFLFAFNLRISIHLLSFGITTSFFIILGLLSLTKFTLVVIICTLLSGLVANARLYLKAHTTFEVYAGFFIGFLVPFGVYYFL